MHLADPGAMNSHTVMGHYMEQLCSLLYLQRLHTMRWRVMHFIISLAGGICRKTQTRSFVDPADLFLSMTRSLSKGRKSFYFFYFLVKYMNVFVSYLTCASLVIATESKKLD